MKISDYIVERILQEKTDKVFGYIGGMIAPLINSLHINKNIEMINMITEQGAGFAAEGYSRTTSKLGVAIATSGPGATNLITPIANCYFDSTPVLFITGQVNTKEYRRYENMRQCGFQETNIVNLVKDITKYANIILRPEDLEYELEKAIKIATTGRKGPVLLDIPFNIQTAEFTKSEKIFTPKNIEYNVDYNAILKILNNAKKPIILVGNGINIAQANNELKQFLDKTQIPVINSLPSATCINGSYQYNMGMIGSYGNRHSNFVFAKSDVILVLGSRLDIRQTGVNVDIFKDKTIIQIDIDENELACDRLNKITFKSDLKVFLEELNKQIKLLNVNEWRNEVLKVKEQYTKNIDYPDKFMEMLLEFVPENTVITTDVGQNQVWSAKNLKAKNGQQFLTSAGHGSMGFSLPSGIGAAICNKKVLVIAGDGGFQMNIQELEIIKRRKLPVKILILNNKNLAMVREFQEIYFDNNFASTVWDYSTPDFERVAEAYEIKSKTYSCFEINENILKEFFNSPESMLLNVIFEQNTHVIPRLTYGCSLDNMNPKVEE